MLLDTASTAPDTVYQMLIQTVLPRPIAWVLTASANGTYNVAPFSFFNVVSNDPPTLVVGIAHKGDGSRKDTLVNLEAGGDCVVHLPHRELAREMVETSRELAYGESELARAGLAVTPWQGRRLPRLAGARIAFACDLARTVSLGGHGHTLALLTVRAIHVDDALFVRDAKGRAVVDPLRLDPVSRLGGDRYAVLGEVFSLARPV